MRCLRFHASQVLALALLWQMRQKLAHSSDVLTFLQLNSAAGMGFEASEELRQALVRRPEPAVLLLNRFAINITANFLCNLALFPGARERVLVFAFDKRANLTLKQAFPDVEVVYWPVPGLQWRLVAGGGPYQLFQLFRARLSAFLARRTNAFWMIQADTVWRADLFSAVNLPDDPLVFDAEGADGLLAKMIAGGYFHVRGGPDTAGFFDHVGDGLLTHFATDNNLMSRLCELQLGGTTCGRLPYSQVVNWRWRPAPDRQIPLLVQFDGGDGISTKFEAMSALGADFVDVDSLWTKENNVSARCFHKEVRAGVLTEQRFLQGASGQKANLIIRFFQSFFELTVAVVPGLQHFLLTRLFPYWAYYLVV